MKIMRMTWPLQQVKRVLRLEKEGPYFLGEFESLSNDTRKMEVVGAYNNMFF
jgi:hypothetical protein